ncbi:low molecular weight protein arginine phosphatase [Salimicrobium flavidum]|uniref:Protein-tyrosine phosphatase n=1 Tax=Salimicrobium flavidum TaxID=570947 RepID=A0A1N7IVS9_9BACI|nr:low molecular weight protein arginine phosphatase [Salimicrobium flavidum]SIS41189.1 protein-tyrosine phosphatase [Salimicrobium flavidum]
MNILFVCTGNTCRSPMAEAILKDKNEGFDVQSAGVFAGEGHPLSAQAREVMEEEDVETDHHSQPVTPELLEWADLILTMTERHKQALAMQQSGYEEKLFTLKEYVLISDEKWERLKSLYSRVEEKRNCLSQEHEGDIGDKWREEAREELEEIEEIEASLPDVNIMDPFGADIDIYRKTYRELLEYIELLIGKTDEKR